MTIAEARGKCKSLLARIPKDTLILGVLVLSATLSFGFGYLAGSEAEQGSTISLEELPVVPVSTTEAGQTGQVVASKNGTKYYLPSCAGANRISPANKVWFTSIADATNAGYTPATNCPGL